MRISVVSGCNYCKPASISYTSRKQKSLEHDGVCKPNGDCISFKGSGATGGGIGSAVGTLAGIGLGAILTIGTGGLAALAVPCLLGAAGCAGGAVGGVVLESKLEDKESELEDDDLD